MCILINCHGALLCVEKCVLFGEKIMMHRRGFTNANAKVADLLKKCHVGGLYMLCGMDFCLLITLCVKGGKNANLSL